MEDSHPSIIPKAKFEMAQAEIARRQRIGRGYSGGSVFSFRVVCGDCGSFYAQVELQAFLDALHDAPTVLDTFDTRLWTALSEKAVVYHDAMIVFQLRSGQEMEAGV